MQEAIYDKFGRMLVDPIELQNRQSLRLINKNLDLFDDLKLDKVEVEGLQDMVHLQNKQLIWLIGILIEYLQITIPSGNIFENVPTSKKANIKKKLIIYFKQ